MKRTLFLGLAALAALTITSCQKDTVLNSVPEQQPIGFGTYVGRDAQTKATSTTLAVMKENDYSGFGVYAYYTGTTAFATFIAVDTDTEQDGIQYHSPNFMTNVNVTWSTDKWDYSNTKYWPNDNDKITFFAYAPYLENPNLGKDNGGYPTVDFTVDNTVANQQDLMYASAIDQYKTYTELGSDDGVKLTFNHALSRIGFKVKTARTDYRIKITSITLTGDFNTSGTCTLKDGSFTTSIPEIDKEYTFSTFNSNNTSKISSTTAIDINEEGNYLMIIPTDFTSEDISVSITYTYEYEYATGLYATETPVVQEGSITNVNFEKGKAYSLVMELDPLKPIKFSVESSVTDWEGPTDETVNMTSINN